VNSPDSLKRIEELASAESFPDGTAELEAHREMAELMVGLPWVDWAGDESAMVDKFRFFLLIEPAEIDSRSGSRVFRHAALDAARLNPAASRLVLDFPSHWTFIELDDLKKWIAARPPGVSDTFADRLGPYLARDIVPQPNLATQLELLEEIITNIPGARAAAAMTYRMWLTTRAEAGEPAENALKRTLAAIADMLRDDTHDERIPFLIEMTLAPALEERSVGRLICEWIDDSQRVRAVLAVLVALMDLDDAAPVLRALAADEVPSLRDSALKSLITIGEAGRFLEEDRKLADEIIGVADGQEVSRELLTAARKLFSRPRGKTH